jgi:hypothetical protein
MTKTMLFRQPYTPIFCMLSPPMRRLFIAVLGEVDGVSPGPREGPRDHRRWCWARCRYRRRGRRPLSPRRQRHLVQRRKPHVLTWRWRWSRRSLVLQITSGMTAQPCAMRDSHSL